jgi:8-oxo-dGTP diphosphatase
MDSSIKLLAEISEGSLGLSNEFEQLGDNYSLRKSARAILLNKEGDIATQYLKNYTYHKLPGGGLESGELPEEALRREVLEEVGCDSKALAPVGMVIEYRNKYKMIHLSFCFVAEVVGEMGEPTLEEGEIEEGQVTLWLPAEEVLQNMKKDQPQKFEGHFILKREIAFLEEYIKSVRI